MSILLCCSFPVYVQWATTGLAAFGLAVSIKALFSTMKNKNSKFDDLKLQDSSYNAKNENFDESDCKMVFLIRQDLNMTKGKIAAQCCHATLAAYNAARNTPYLKSWEETGQAKITLKVPTGDEMLELASKARSMGLVAKTITDAGRTQISAGTKTVTAIGPGPVKMIDYVTGHLKLY